MNIHEHSEYVTRDGILKLLSDDEVGSVSTAETATGLATGDEYVDLEQLDLGVQRAPGKSPPMGRVVPRKAVHETTWNKILAHLADAPKAWVNPEARP